MSEEKKVANVMSVTAKTPSELDEFLARILDGNGQVDFDRIIPIPPDVYLAVHSMEPWCAENWGTDRDAFECGVMKCANGREAYIAFLTAGEAPMPVYSRIGEEFPKLAFTVDYAGEDPSEDSGQFSIVHGKIRHRRRNLPEMQQIFIWEQFENISGKGEW